MSIVVVAVIVVVDVDNGDYLLRTRISITRGTVIHWVEHRISDSKVPGSTPNNWHAVLRVLG